MIATQLLYFASIWLACSAGDSKDKKKNDSKKDLAPAETRIGSILPYGAYEAGYNSPLGYGGHGPLLAPVHGAHGLGYGPDYGLEMSHGLGPAGLIHKPLGYVDGVGYNGGYLKSGINEGGLALGNQGAHLYKIGNDGRYADGSYHDNGLAQNSGYQGIEGYKDNKHHVADDFANRAYYNGAQGARKDLGNGQIYDKSQGYSQNGYNTLGDNELSGHNKGHRRTGFKKSYHKDESGNDESFYDVDHDEGNREVGKKYGDQYGNNFASNINGAHKFNEFDAQQHGQNGYEGNGKLVALNQGIKDYYGGNDYYNNGKKFGSLGGGQSANYGKYGVQNGYHNDFNNGHNLEGYQGSKFGNGYYGPRGF